MVIPLHVKKAKGATSVDGNEFPALYEDTGVVPDSLAMSSLHVLNFTFKGLFSSIQHVPRKTNLTKTDHWLMKNLDKRLCPLIKQHQGLGKRQ